MRLRLCFVVLDLRARGCGLHRNVSATVELGVVRGSAFSVMANSKSDPFFHPKARLKRAEEKISELDTTIWEYRYKHPPALVCEPDEPDRLTKTYKFKFAAVSGQLDAFAH